jgi:hypothetical protein
MNPRHGFRHMLCGREYKTVVYIFFNPAVPPVKTVNPTFLGVFANLLGLRF